MIPPLLLPGASPQPRSALNTCPLKSRRHSRLGKPAQRSFDGRKNLQSFLALGLHLPPAFPGNGSKLCSCGVAQFSLRLPRSAIASVFSFDFRPPGAGRGGDSRAHSRTHRGLGTSGTGSLARTAQYAVQFSLEGVDPVFQDGRLSELLCRQTG